MLSKKTAYEIKKEEDREILKLTLIQAVIYGLLVVLSYLL